MCITALGHYLCWKIQASALAQNTSTLVMLMAFACLEGWITEYTALPQRKGGECGQIYSSKYM